MKKYLVIFILFAIAYCLAKITVSSNIDDKQCDVFVQVNEDSDVIFLETMHIPGQYMTTACWGTVATMCHVKQDEVSYINGMKMNGTTTFLNNENQICYFENLGLSVGNMSGFYYQPWSYVYSVNIRVSCEDYSSVPQYCAKTEKMAKQVLLAKEELECEAEGGKFEGGVYRFKMPNDSIEYCVAGRCDVCHSQWYKKFVEHWKDSVCCETRGKEPNTNNGTCISPPPFDSTKIGVNHSKITAFPGCSKADAGTNNNFCYRSSSSSVSSSSVASSSSNISSSSISSSSAESSSSDVSSSSENSSSSAKSSSSNDSSSSEDSSSSGDSSSSAESSSSNDSSSSEESSSSGDSSSSDESSSSNDSSSSEESSSSGASSSSAESSSSYESSSSEEPYSSSEEQEDANCHPNSSEAQATLHNAEAECWSMQMESGYQLDDNGCLTGECYGGIYSSDYDDGLSSTSEWESSSSEEERCIDVSLKKTSDEETDQWVYVGKEKYTSRTVSYEEITPSSGFFDALGRIYKTIKSKIKYFMGIDTKVKKTVEIGEELEVWKRNFIDFSGNEAVSYIKKDGKSDLFIDSSIYLDETYSVLEINNKKNYVRLRMTNGIEYYDIYDEFDNIERSYSVSVEGDTLEEKLDNYKTEIDFSFNEDVNVLKNVSYKVDYTDDSKIYNTQRLVLAKKTYACDEFGTTVDGAIPAICEHPDKPSNDYFKGLVNPVELLYYPGLIVPHIDQKTWKTKETTSDATFGELKMKSPKFSFKCECTEKNQYIHTYNIESDKNPYVIIYASNWEYNTKENSWTRKCWGKDDMKKTYNHEMEHYRNREDYMKEIAGIFFTKQIFHTKDECINTGKDLEKDLNKSYFRFMNIEAGHNGDGHKYPVSPEPTSKNNRKGREIPCSK